MTFTCSGTITLTSMITISANTTIDGSGQAVIISGNNYVRLFNVNNGKTLSLYRLTIADGNSPLGDGGGGGILNYGTTNVNHSTFSGNHAGDRGGGIYNIGGTLTIGNSTFTDNTATWGGVLYNDDLGSLSVSNNTFSSNGVLEVGGSILNDGSVVDVRNSTFSDNSAPGNGGGISNSGTLTVSNSTFSDKSGNWHGGGISNSGILTVSNSTFSGNSSDDGSSIENDNGTLHLGNSIVTNSPTGENCAGLIYDDGGNLTFGDATCPGTHGDPLLGPLQDNGGPTHTMALSLGSPAIDTAVTAICTAPPVNNRDQRGENRPVDGDDDSQAACDIGSFEYQPLVPTTRYYLPMVSKY